MNIDERQLFIEDNLTAILGELRTQNYQSFMCRENELSIQDTMDEVEEFVNVDEYGLAYEIIVSLLEIYPFALSGRCCIRLLEVGLLVGYKSNDNDDRDFDMRRRLVTI